MFIKVNVKSFISVMLCGQMETKYICKHILQTIAVLFCKIHGCIFKHLLM